MPARRPRLLGWALLGTALAALVACSGGTGAPDQAAPDRFDADRAFALLRAQVAMGPRPAGSDASRTLARRLRDRLPNGRLDPLPGGLANVVGHLPGRGRAVLVGAHYDTKDLPGFVGANDSASGTAVVAELARSLRRGRRACERELRFVFFDGEESPPGATDFYSAGLRGSKAYAAANARRLSAVVIVDFVGDRRLSLPREAGSDEALWARLRAAAARARAARVFPDRSRGEILDDHTPFRLAGVPAVDLIDFTYPHFHRRTDTLDKVSARSLDLVGESLVVFLRELAAETCG